MGGDRPSTSRDHHYPRQTTGRHGRRWQSPTHRASNPRQRVSVLTSQRLQAFREGHVWTSSDSDDVDASNQSRESEDGRRSPPRGSLCDGGCPSLKQRTNGHLPSGQPVRHSLGPSSSPLWWSNDMVDRTKETNQRSRRSLPTESPTERRPRTCAVEEQFDTNTENREQLIDLLSREFQSLPTVIEEFELGHETFPGLRCYGVDDGTFQYVLSLIDKSRPDGVEKTWVKVVDYFTDFIKQPTVKALQCPGGAFIQAAAEILGLDTRFPQAFIAPIGRFSCLNALSSYDDDSLMRMMDLLRSQGTGTPWAKHIFNFLFPQNLPLFLASLQGKKFCSQQVAYERALSCNLQDLGKVKGRHYYCSTKNKTAHTGNPLPSGGSTSNSPGAYSPEVLSSARRSFPAGEAPKVPSPQRLGRGMPHQQEPPAQRLSAQQLFARGQSGPRESPGMESPYQFNLSLQARRETAKLSQGRLGSRSLPLGASLKLPPLELTISAKVPYPPKDISRDAAKEQHLLFCTAGEIFRATMKHEKWLFCFRMTDPEQCGYYPTEYAHIIHDASEATSAQVPWDPAPTVSPQSEKSLRYRLTDNEKTPVERRTGEAIQNRRPGTNGGSGERPNDGSLQTRREGSSQMPVSCRGVSGICAERMVRAHLGEQRPNGWPHSRAPKSATPINKHADPILTKSAPSTKPASSTEVASFTSIASTAKAARSAWPATSAKPPSGRPVLGSRPALPGKPGLSAKAALSTRTPLSPRLARPAPSKRRTATHQLGNRLRPLSLPSSDELEEGEVRPPLEFSRPLLDVAPKGPYQRNEEGQELDVTQRFDISQCLDTPQMQGKPEVGDSSPNSSNGKQGITCQRLSSTTGVPSTPLGTMCLNKVFEAMPSACNDESSVEEMDVSAWSGGQGPACRFSRNQTRDVERRKRDGCAPYCGTGESRRRSGSPKLESSMASAHSRTSTPDPSKASSFTSVASGKRPSLSGAAIEDNEQISIDHQRSQQESAQELITGLIAGQRTGVQHGTANLSLVEMQEGLLEGPLLSSYLTIERPLCHGSHNDVSSPTLPQLPASLETPPSAGGFSGVRPPVQEPHGLESMSSNADHGCGSSHTASLMDVASDPGVSFGLSGSPPRMDEWNPAVLPRSSDGVGCQVAADNTERTASSTASLFAGKELQADFTFGSIVPKGVPSERSSEGLELSAQPTYPPLGDCEPQVHDTSTCGTKPTSSEEKPDSDDLLVQMVQHAFGRDADPGPYVEIFWKNGICAEDVLDETFHPEDLRSMNFPGAAASFKLWKAVKWLRQRAPIL